VDVGRKQKWVQKIITFARTRTWNIKKFHYKRSQSSSSLSLQSVSGLEVDSYRSSCMHKPLSMDVTTCPWKHCQTNSSFHEPQNLVVSWIPRTLVTGTLKIPTQYMKSHIMTKKWVCGAQLVVRE
jgi:hypothetical protein